MRYEGVCEEAGDGSSGGDVSVVVDSSGGDELGDSSFVGLVGGKVVACSVSGVELSASDMVCEIVSSLSICILLGSFDEGASSAAMPNSPISASDVED